jgi:hypothetical protein
MTIQLSHSYYLELKYFEMLITNLWEATSSFSWVLWGSMPGGLPRGKSLNYWSPSIFNPQHSLRLTGLITVSLSALPSLLSIKTSIL